MKVGFPFNAIIDASISDQFSSQSELMISTEAEFALVSS